MGKISENMNNLSKLLNTSEEPAAKVDDIPTEIKRSPGRPKKKVVSYYTYCGMAVPNEIYDICMYLEGLLKDQGKWNPALGPQVYNCAVQQYIYNDLITAKITGREPVATRQLTTASESLRRALQSTGLTVNDKKSGITKEQTEVNPLQAFLEKMDDGGPDEVISKKPKKKGAK
jgi:hypothetical protein